MITRASTRVATASVPRRSSDLTSAYALLVEPTEKYVNQKTHPQKHFVPGARAASTFKLYFNSQSEIVLSAQARGRY